MQEFKIANIHYIYDNTVTSMLHVMLPHSDHCTLPSMTNLSQRITALAAIVAAAALCVLACQSLRGKEPLPTDTRYQAVALMNGQVFFGHIEHAGPEFITLRDVFYIQARQNPETRAVASVLVKRGGEAHAPDSMQISRQHVMLVEPVKADSQIAKLIAEQGAKTPR